MIFGLTGLCAWYIVKVLVTGKTPTRYGPDADLTDNPTARYVTAGIYGILMLFGLFAGISLLTKP